MRTLHAIDVCVLALIGVSVIQSSPACIAGDAPASAPADAVDAQFLYRCEAPGTGLGDLVRLRDGTIRLGKAVEWGTRVYVYDAAGRRAVVDGAEVERVEHRVDAMRSQRPQKPDLTVAFVERTPRDASWQGRVNYSSEGKPGIPVTDGELKPSGVVAGQAVTFRVHIRNAGAAESKPFGYRVLLDGRELKSGRVDEALGAGKDQTIDAGWTWEDGQHELRVELDADKANDEVCRWNNTFVDHVRAQGVFACVPRSIVAEFEKAQNIVDTHGFEDWLQAHVRVMNRLFEESVHPGCPHGADERVRIDKIVVVDDTTDEKSWDTMRRRDGDAKNPIEYGVTWVVPTPAAGRLATIAPNRFEWNILGEWGRGLGLIDLRNYDTALNNCLVRDSGGRLINVRHTLPARSLMHGDMFAPLSEVCAAYLNRTLGRPRGFHGDFQYALPAKCVLEVRSDDGRPLDGVNIEIYQRQAGGAMDGFITDDKLCVSTTGADGRMELPNRPATPCATPGGFRLTDNPWGIVDASGRNGLMLARLSRESWEEYQFICINEFNAATLRGESAAGAIILSTQLPRPGATPKIDLTRYYWDDPRLTAVNKVKLHWPHWSYGAGAGATSNVSEYRVYRKFGNGGDGANAWRMVDVVKPNAPGPDQIAHESILEFGRPPHSALLAPLMDTYCSVTKVGFDGLESVPSAPLMFAPADEWLRMAVDANLNCYIPIAGNAESAVLLCEMNRYPPGEFTRPMGLRIMDERFRERRVEGKMIPAYRPSASGAALDRDGVLILADATNHQIAWYDKGVLIRLAGKSPYGPAAAGNGDGEFSMPMDVAVDSKGRVYVADSGNHRVQVLDASGKFLFAFGKQGTGDDQFDGPTALGMCRDTLAVTDYGNKRLVIFNVKGDRPERQRIICKLHDPDRALVGPTTGEVFVCDKNDCEEWAMVVYPPKGDKPTRSFTSVNSGPVHRPRGLCYDGKGFGLFSNNQPLQIGVIGVE